MALKIHDTLTGRLGPFTPRNPGKVGVYCCGPTTYDVAHVGHARAAVQPITQRCPTQRLPGGQCSSVRHATQATTSGLVVITAATIAALRVKTKEAARQFHLFKGYLQWHATVGQHLRHVHFAPLGRCVGTQALNASHEGLVVGGVVQTGH